jgi:hypothetical protein
MAAGGLRFAPRPGNNCAGSFIDELIDYVMSFPDREEDTNAERCRARS